VAHAVAHNIEFQVGDVLVSETSAPTVAVTPDGIDIRTDYPRDIERLTISPS
jgi:hypothetical protein